MSHRNARLTVHGRLLLVQRVRIEGWAVAHAAKAMGVSRQCAHYWLKRYDQEGEDGLRDRSSRPRSSPRQTPPQVVERIVACRRAHRRGPDWIGAELGVPARTVSRVLRRARVPYLRELDPMTGEQIRSSKATEWAYRYLFTGNQDRRDALAPWLDTYNTERRHSALGGLPPISRLSPT